MSRMQAPQIINQEKKVLLGYQLRMSLVNNRTFELWQHFMINRNEIAHGVGTDKYSLQVYDSPSYFEEFDPNEEFTKWALIEVDREDNLPDGMELFYLPEGLYAVFQHKGGSDSMITTFEYIFGEWLPNSAYLLDDRPHFEKLGEKYLKDSEESEEEVWIPIKAK